MRLQGKVVTITGAASGMGKVTALLFAREGARVVAADVNEKGGTEVVGLVKESGGQAAFIRTDVGDSRQVQGMVNFAVETYGKLDVMYNNAGIFGGRGGPIEVSEEDWDKTMDVNLRGTFLCCKYGIPEMIKSGGGSIINTASIASFTGGGAPGKQPNCAYNTSKAGIVQLTRTTAFAYGRKGIRANAILPGFVDTPMGAPGLGSPGVMDTVIDMLPIPRLGRPEDIANLALFLASDESSYITGASIVIDGGFTVSYGPVYKD